MVDFCPECSNLLRKQRLGDKTLFVCKCGYQREIKTSLKDINESIQKKKRSLENNLIIITEKDKISVYPQVTKICPKCNNKIAETWQQQMRSADEPSTHFFRCLKCKMTWREY